MIRSMSTLLLTFIFTFTQAMAFVPNQDQKILGEKLESIDANDLKSKGHVSKKEFEKSQKKIIAGLKKEYKKVRKKSVGQQTRFAVNKLRKRFKRFRAMGKLSLKNNKRMAKIAAKNGTSIEEVKGAYKNSFSKEKEVEVKTEMLAKIEKHGSYAGALKAGIEEIENTTYESVAAKNKNSQSEINRKPAQFEILFWAFLVFYLIIPVILVVILTLFFAAGGIVGGAIFSVFFAGYLIWITTA